MRNLVTLDNRILDEYRASRFGKTEYGKLYYSLLSVHSDRVSQNLVRKEVCGPQQLSFVRWARLLSCCLWKRFSATWRTCTASTTVVLEEQIPLIPIVSLHEINSICVMPPKHILLICKPIVFYWTYSVGFLSLAMASSSPITQWP